MDKYDYSHIVLVSNARGSVLTMKQTAIGDSYKLFSDSRITHAHVIYLGTERYGFVEELAEKVSSFFALLSAKAERCLGFASKH